jgi:hypothetical protein
MPRSVGRSNIMPQFQWFKSSQCYSDERAPQSMTETWGSPLLPDLAGSFNHVHAGTCNAQRQQRQQVARQPSLCDYFPFDT